MATKTDTAWGIENNELIAPSIFLWRRPGVAMKAENLTGAVAHNTEVEVLKRVEYKGSWYVKCKQMVIFEENEYLQRGWCVETMLKNKGRST